MKKTIFISVGSVAAFIAAAITLYWLTDVAVLQWAVYKGNLTRDQYLVFALPSVYMMMQQAGPFLGAAVGCLFGDHVYQRVR